MEVLQVVTDEAETNAAATMAALIFNDLFDFKLTYFIIAGVAGVNPYESTIGSVAFALYAVQVGLAYEFDTREVPTTFDTGYIPLGAKYPNEYPWFPYGTEAFELNLNLRDRAARIASKANLNNSDTAIAYRANYTASLGFPAVARSPPAVVKCDVTKSDVFFHGALLGDSFSKYVDLLTNGTGTYCMTAQEDNAILEACVRGAVAGRLDFGRIFLMRAEANFDRAPEELDDLDQLFNKNRGGFLPALAKIYLADSLVVGHPGQLAGCL